MVTLLLLAAALAASRVPSATLTPGLVETTDTAAVCQPGYAAAHRLVSDSRKRDVYAAYGIRPASRTLVSKRGLPYQQSDYEVDHRVSIELGGSNLPANLWIQSYRLPRFNAWWKDALENRLHWLVCTGRTLTLVDAQAALLGDWTVAYDAYITHGPPPPKKPPIPPIPPTGFHRVRP